MLDPVFNRYTDLPPGRTRADVEELARRSGVDVGDVLVVDASRRTTGANAYVVGLGHTKRVVLYDTLLQRFTPAQVRVVVAHELGHVKHRDVPRGILWVAIVAPGAMLLVMLLTTRWSARAGTVPGTAASLPAFALALSLVVFAGTIVSNQLSRAVEARADADALELTGEARAFIGMERRLARGEPQRPGSAAALPGHCSAPTLRWSSGSVRRVAYERASGGGGKRRRRRRRASVSAAAPSSCSLRLVACSSSCSSSSVRASSSCGSSSSGSPSATASASSNRSASSASSGGSRSRRRPRRAAPGRRAPR